MNLHVNQKLIIEYESTPNPNSLKFYPVGFDIAPGKFLEFKKNSSFVNSALARDLLEMNEIESVFYGSDFISVSKDPNLNCDWSDLRAKIIFIILGHEKEIIEGRIFDFEGENSESLRHEEDADSIEFDECDKETVDQIIELLDEEIRPRIALDGGDIRLRAYKDGIAYLELRGACSSCPSSTSTLYDYVREFLISMVEKLIDIERI